MSSAPSPPEASPLRDHPRGVTLDLLIQPRASRTELAGIHDGAWRVRIAAPPVDGAANATLIEFLSKRLGVRRADIEIVSGERGRRKRVLIAGASRLEILKRLEGCQG